MDTNIVESDIRVKRSAYRQHSIDFKRMVVAQSFAAETSVSRVSRAHNVNANQVFAWRKLFRAGAYDIALDQQVKLVPVRLSDPMPVSVQPLSASPAVANGVVILEVGKARLRLEGLVDSAMLALVMERLLA
ncbi:IS66-like element accessory protein TnpA [Glaciimonas immobilis]|uniref:Transposase n=1 Tax=Glaciimonas immobilis TaxID=728004 RepID=A0A840RTS7_9BURK|nr:transposase [Glaciimonas immobilis]KAF3997031.1 transposase [Glaciimonas immobilis]MBB5199869.1 transposase [Glaciimonas immobilis]